MPGKPIESAEEWGRRQAASAPSWSDAKWQRICAILRINIATSNTKSSPSDDQADDESQSGAKAA